MIKSFALQQEASSYPQCGPKSMCLPHARRETTVELNSANINNVNVPRGGHALIGVFFECVLPGIANVDTAKKQVISDNDAVHASDESACVVETALISGSVKARPYWNRNVAHMLMGKTWSLKIGGTEYMKTNPLKNMLFTELFESKGIYYNETYGNHRMSVDDLKNASAYAQTIRIPVWCSANLTSKQSIVAAAIHFHDFQLSVSDNEISYASIIRNAGLHTNVEATTGDAGYNGDLNDHSTGILQDYSLATSKSRSGVKSRLASSTTVAEADLDTPLPAEYAYGSSTKRVGRRAVFQWALYDQQVAEAMAKQPMEHHVYEPLLIAADATLADGSQKIDVEGNGDFLSLHMTQVTKEAFAGAGLTTLNSDGIHKFHNLGHVFLKVANKADWNDDDKDSKQDAHRLYSNFSEVFDYGLREALRDHIDSGCVLPTNRFNTVQLTAHFAFGSAAATGSVATASGTTCVLAVRSQVYKYQNGTICKVLAQGNGLQI